MWNCEGEIWFLLEAPICWRCQSHGMLAGVQTRYETSTTEKLEGVRPEELLTLDREMQSLEFALMILGLGLVQYFLTILNSLPFGRVMYILCH